MNFEPAVMRKLERWSNEENEEETEDGIRQMAVLYGECLIA